METIIREPVVAYDKSIFSEEEYLQLEKAADRKREFFRGEIFAMSVRRGGIIKCFLIFLQRLE